MSETSMTDRQRGEQLALAYATSRSPTVFFVARVDAERLVYLSANSERLLGYPREQLEPAGWRLLIHPDDQHALESLHSATSNDSEGLRVSEGEEIAGLDAREHGVKVTPSSRSAPCGRCAPRPRCRPSAERQCAGFLPPAGPGRTSAATRDGGTRAFSYN